MTPFHFEFASLAYDDSEIVKHFEIVLSHQKVAAVIGPSGCGKTTILNCIAGLVTFPNVNIASDFTIGYIFQDARLIPWLTVKDNLKLIDPSIDDDKLEEILHDVKLNGTEEKYPIELSGGMQKRVSIARAFVNQPSLILLDEPFSSLDAPTTAHLIGLVDTMLKRNNASAMVVTHDLHEALLMADDIYFMSNKPSTIIKHFSNPLRNQSSTVTDISNIEKELLHQHPELLAGKL